MFTLQNAPRGDKALEGLRIESCDTEGYNSRFDLQLGAYEYEGRLHGSFRYNTDLFDAERIERMLGQFRTLLEGIVANPDQRLSRLPLLPEAERRQVLVEWNATQAGH